MKVNTSNTQFRGGSGGGLAFPIIIFWLVVAYLLFGCGPASKLRRAEKLIAKAEQQGAQWTRDTVFIDTPVFIEEVKRDSIFFSLPGDTVRIEKDRLRVTYVRLPGDSVYIEGKCLPDTVKVSVPITITNTIESESVIKWWWLIIAACVGAVIAFFRR
jgi:hypothetical protein